MSFLVVLIYIREEETLFFSYSYHSKWSRKELLCPLGESWRDHSLLGFSSRLTYSHEQKQFFW